MEKEETRRLQNALEAISATALKRVSHSEVKVTELTGTEIGELQDAKKAEVAR